MYAHDKFSPYLDPEPIAEFFDDIGQRSMVTTIAAVLVHIGIFLFLQAKLDVPNIPEEPKPINIEIISFLPDDKPDVASEPEPEPEPDLRPAVPPPAQAPTPKPEPKPIPKPEPLPKPVPEPLPSPLPKPEPIPEPIPEPKPEPLPEPIVAPPLPPIIKAPEPVIMPEPVVEPVVEPIVEPEPIAPVEPVAQPSLDIFDPTLVTPPDPDLAPEPARDTYSPVQQAAQVPAPVTPLFDPNLLNDDTDLQDLAPLDDQPEFAPTPVVTDEPAVGVKTPDPIPPEQTPIAPPPLFQPDIVTTNPAPSSRDLDLAPSPDIEAPALPPSILASEQAPTNKAEADKAIPQSQATTPLDLLLKDRGNSGMPSGNPKPNPGGPTASGGPPAFGGSTPRKAPGASGWQVKGDWPKDGLPGGKGILRDIDCRGEDRDHEDCPEYIRKHQGRDASGRESFGAHAPRGTTTVPRSRVMTGGTQTAPNIGERGSPSTGILGDVGGFAGQYAGDNVTPRQQGRRLRDVFEPPKPAPWTITDTLPEPPPDDEDADKLIILKKPDE